MAKRKIIKIDEEKCNGCGLCIPNCPEGALQIIDGKARLISDLFCDGLGACIGHCPEGAIIREEREAEPYDERKVMENIIKQGDNTILAHLEHLEDHGEKDFLATAKEVLKENTEALRIAQVQYDNGAVDLLSVLQLQLRADNSKINLLSINNARLIQRINLHLSLGGDFE